MQVLSFHFLRFAFLGISVFVSDKKGTSQGKMVATAVRLGAAAIDK